MQHGIIHVYGIPYTVYRIRGHDQQIYLHDTRVGAASPIDVIPYVFVGILCG